MSACQLVSVSCFGGCRLLCFLVLGDEPSNGMGTDLQVDPGCAGQGATIEEIERALPTPPKRGTPLY